MNCLVVRWKKRKMNQRAKKPPRMKLPKKSLATKKKKLQTKKLTMSYKRDRPSSVILVSHLHGFAVGHLGLFIIAPCDMHSDFHLTMISFNFVIHFSCELSFNLIRGHKHTFFRTFCFSFSGSFLVCHPFVCSCPLYILYCDEAPRNAIHSFCSGV